MSEKLKGCKDKELSTSTKSETPKEKIPLIRIPRELNEEMYIYFDEKGKEIKISFYRNGVNTEIFNLDSMPIEECNECHMKLGIDSAFYTDDERKIMYYCSTCSKLKKDIIKLNSSNEIKYEQSNIVSNLEIFKDDCTIFNNRYISQMRKLIEYSNYITKYYEVIQKKSNDFFKIQINIIKYFLEGISHYLSICSEIKINNIYLFLKNLFIVCISEFDKSWFVKYFIGVFNEHNSFNIPYIRKMILKRISKLTFNKDINMEADFLNLFVGKPGKNAMCINFFEHNFSDKIEISSKFNQFFFTLDIFRLSSIFIESKIEKTISEIKEIKKDIKSAISNYYLSFNLVPSKFILERKIINLFIHSILRRFYSSFKDIKENDNIINSILKELNKMYKYLDKKGEIAEPLKKKIWNQINFYESKTKNKESNSSTLWRKGNPYIEKQNLIITEKEKLLLENYKSENADNENYSTIIVRKDIPNIKLNLSAGKLQVIIDFLFFLRKKTIDVIHLLSKHSSSFFSLFNDINTNEMNQVQNIISVNDDSNLPELLKEINLNSSENYSQINEHIFKKIRVGNEKKIKFKHAFQYFFKESIISDYSKELDYLYDNIILSKESEIKIQKMINNAQNEIHSITAKFEINFDEIIFNKKEINENYKILDNKFVEDPFYQQIQKYFSNIKNLIINSKLFVTSKNINFYKKFCDNFNEYRQLYISKINY